MANGLFRASHRRRLTLTNTNPNQVSTLTLTRSLRPAMAAHLPGAAPPESLEAHPDPSRSRSPSPKPNPSLNPSADPEPCPSPDLAPNPNCNFRLRRILVTNPNCNFMRPGDRHLRELAHQRARVRGGRAARRLDHCARRGRRQVGNLDSYSHVLTMYLPRACCVYLLSTYYGQPLQLRLRAVLQQGQSAPLAVPQLGSCASSGRAWWLWAARHSQGRGRATERSATALCARASCLQSRPTSLRLTIQVLAHMAGAEGAAAPRGQRVGRAPLSRR